MENKLPKKWVKIPFGEIILTKKGKKPKTTVSEPAEGYLPYILIYEMEGKGIRSFTNDEKVPIVNLEDVLVVWDGSIGKCASGLHGAIGSTLVAITPLGNVPTRLIEFFIKYKNQYIHQTSTGTGLQHINKNFFKDCLIPLPPLKEQHRIVAKLDTLFTHLEVLNTRLATIPKLLKNFKQAVLTQAVTGKITEEWRKGKDLESSSIINECEALHWNKKQLKKYKEEVAELNLTSVHSSWSVTSPGVLCEKIVDGTHHTPKYQESGIKFLSAKNIREWYIDEKGCKFISKEEHENLIKRCNPKKGSLLITKSGTIGRMAVIKSEPDYSLFESVAVMTPVTENVNPYILGYALQVFLENGGNEKHVKGTAVQHLHLTELRVLPIQLPSVKEQIEIVKRVESLFAKADKIENQYKILKEKTESLPQAILAKAFKGELVTQLPTDGSAKELLAEIQKLKASVAPKKKTKKKVKV